MKFQIDRASDNGKYDTPPVEGAVQEGKTASNNPRWIVEVGGLEGLLDLMKREGSIVLSSGQGELHPDTTQPPQITIYDDYME